MRLLLTNDDGFDAEGMQALAENLKGDHELWIVAPDTGRSCCSHGVTHATSLQVRRRTEKGWEVSGTPADCVRVGIQVLQLQPDVVLSGVNHGGNLGIDTLFSGTVAGAREGAMLGCRAIAISQYLRPDVGKDWMQSAERARIVLETLWEKGLEKGEFWNLNLPAIEPESWRRDEAFPISYCELEPSLIESNYRLLDGEATDSEFTLQYQSNYQSRPRGQGTDVALCFAGHATITRLGTM